MIPLVITLPGYEYLGKLIKKRFTCSLVEITITEFPDGESYVRLNSTINGGVVFIVGSLDRPNAKLLPLIFLISKLKEIGVNQVVLVAPYLPYMRQDKEFNPGECVTSVHFARLLSQYLGHLITIDPHLHRHHSLKEIYNIPSQCLHSAPLLAKWITQHITKPVVFGPDSESKQWVKEIAMAVNAPYRIFSKQRLAKDQVAIDEMDLSEFQDYTPVIVDDIISTAGTMVTLAKHLQQQLSKAPICLAVHGVFAGDAYQQLIKSGVSEIVTTNSINKISGKIDISPLLVSAMQNYTESPTNFGNHETIDG